MNHDLGEKTTISTNYRIGDCIELMHELQDDSVDLVCTDPPYGYSFMGLAMKHAAQRYDPLYMMRLLAVL